MDLEKTISNTITKSITALCIGAGVVAAGYLVYKSFALVQNSFAYDMYSMFYTK